MTSDGGVTCLHILYLAKQRKLSASGTVATATRTPSAGDATTQSHPPPSPAPSRASGRPQGRAHRLQQPPKGRQRRR
jgi:hypothetical protein